jgi:hypothetical protein
MARLILFIAAGLFLFSCNKEKRLENFKDDPTILTVYGTWKLISRENYTTGEVIYKDPSVVQQCGSRTKCDIILNFVKASSGDSLYGHTIMNEVSGLFSFDAATRRFTTASFGGTKVGEPGWSDHIWDNMYRIQNFRINRYYLRLYFNNDTESLTFERQ